MNVRVLLRPLKWAAVLGLLGGLFALAYVFRGQLDRRAADEAAEAAPPPRRVQNNVVKLGAKLAESFGLKDEPARSARWHGGVTVYGRVVPNPRATVEVRAPFAGTLRGPADGEWPPPGRWVKAGEVLGWLDVRFGPQERLDLLTKLTEARASWSQAEEVFRIQQEKITRYEAAGKSVSQSDLDQARQQLAEAKAQLARAKETVKQWQDALGEIDRPGDHGHSTWSYRVAAPADGEVAEVAGRPGVAVEAGALIARIVDPRRALVRLDVPLSALAAGPPARLDLSAPAATPPALEGATNRPEPEKATPSVPAVLAGAAAQLDASSQFAGYWYEVDLSAAYPTDADAAPETIQKAAAAAVGGGVWRPGLFVKGRLLQGEARAAVSVPETALLYHQGRALVYVRVGPGRYERREVQVLGREGDRWLLASGVAAGEDVVSRRAQVLLSEEFRGDADAD